MSSRNCYISNFLQPGHNAFLKDVEVKLIEKTQDSDQIKQEFSGKRTLKTFYPDCLNIESDHRNVFVFTSTLDIFKLELSFPGRLVNSAEELIR